MLQRLNDAIATTLAERGCDHRTVFLRAVALPPDGSLVELETSDAGLASELIRRMDLAAAQAGLVRVVTLPAAGLPELLVPVSSVADVRRSPSHAAELVSQAVCGDPLQPLKREGDWYLVRMDDGYLGWVRSWHVAATNAERHAAFAHRAGHRVLANVAGVLTAPDGAALPLTDLVAGTPLVAAPGGRRGWLAAELPDGRTGFVRSRDVEKRPRAGAIRREALAATGRRFLGIPYLWGGTTPKGFDCSGLVQRIFRLHGLRLPRDSDQQSQFGKELHGITPADLRAGDLLFFGASAQRITHVGMALGDGTFLHAYGQVLVTSLDPTDARSLPELARIWRSSRDPLAER